MRTVSFSYLELTELLSSTEIRDNAECIAGESAIHNDALRIIMDLDQSIQLSMLADHRNTESKRSFQSVR